MNLSQFSVRLAVVCLATASAGLSLAIISIAKVILVITTVIVMLRDQSRATTGEPWQRMWTPKLVLVILFVFAISLLWTSSPMPHALGMMGKYGKFLVIPALLVLIRTPRDAAWALGAFLGAQVCLLLSSWLLYFHIPVKWATANTAQSTYAVFSSYLDQGIMSAVVAAVFWHLRTLAPSQLLYFGSSVMSLLALGGAFIVFIGRTGHVVGIAMVSMAIFWALPRRYKFASLLMPPLISAIAIVSFDNVASRFQFTKTEISAYAAKSDVPKEAQRLDLWRTSIEAIAERPLTGSGIGSWVTEYNKIERLKNPAYVDIGHKITGNHGNPHQEFLLWGVQLGMGGILLLIALLAAVLSDLSRMDKRVARAGLSVLVALVISCLFNSTLSDAYIGDFFCISIGILLAFGIRFDSVSSPKVPIPIRT
jgi:O-antigen ligase